MSGHIQLGDCIMGECDSPLHWHTYIYYSNPVRANRIRPNQHSPNIFFNNIKDKNTLTFGLGYRGNVVYADLAYKYDVYQSDFYAFDDIDLPATKVDNSRNQLVFTLGARF